MRGTAEPSFLWHDQPRVERALRDGRALDAQELTPRGRLSRSTTRVNAAGAAESRYDSSARDTARTSGIVEMLGCTYQRHCETLGPEILVDVSAALCERWAQGVRRKSGHLRWATSPRTGGPSDGRLCQVTPRYFLTRLVPPSRSQRSSTWCRRGWYFVQRGSTLSSPYFPFLPLLFFPRRLCSSARSLPPIASGVSFTSAYLGRLSVVVKVSRVLHLHFDLDCLGHGPPCGRTAALS